jgi:hypothetical protein
MIAHVHASRIDAGSVATQLVVTDVRSRAVAGADVAEVIAGQLPLG